MSKQAARFFSRDFKLRAVSRMLDGENVSALARELSIRRKLLYEWRDAFRSGGPTALRGRRERMSKGGAEVSVYRTRIAVTANGLRETQATGLEGLEVYQAPSIRTRVPSHALRPRAEPRRTGPALPPGTLPLLAPRRGDHRRPPRRKDHSDCRARPLVLPDKPSMDQKGHFIGWLVL